MSTTKLLHASHTHTHTTQHRIQHASVGQTHTPHTIYNRKTAQTKNRTLSKPHSVVYKLKSPTPTQREQKKKLRLFFKKQTSKLNLRRTKVGLRNFIEQLQKKGELTKITKPVSTEYEMAGIINALRRKTSLVRERQRIQHPRRGGSGFF